jgi:hypothetical protein
MSSTAFYRNAKKNGKMASIAKKRKKDKEINSRPEQRKKRAELNREARKRKIYGKRKKMGKDLHHKSGGGLVLINSSKNRGKKEKSRVKGSKRNG